MLNHKMTIPEGVKVYKKDILLGTVPVEYDLSGIPPIYHIEVLGAIQRMGTKLVSMGGQFQTDVKGNVIFDEEGKPVLMEGNPLEGPETP